MVVNGFISPEQLPSTTGAAKQHSLRGYHQFHDWMAIERQSRNATEYGWKKEDNLFTPIPTNEEIAPTSLLKIICCNCKGDIDSCKNNKCSCWSYGFTCHPAFGQ